jgi:hypothetical protein
VGGRPVGGLNVTNLLHGSLWVVTRAMNNGPVTFKIDSMQKARLETAGLKNSSRKPFKKYCKFSETVQNRAN